MKVSIVENKINISGEINVKILEKIDAVCHRKKHLYLSGYEHGRKTRKKMAHADVVFRKWDNFPGVCIAYTFSKKEDGLIISAFMAQQKREKRYTEDELQWFLSQWQQDVTDELEQILS